MDFPRKFENTDVYFLLWPSAKSEACTSDGEITWSRESLAVGVECPRLEILVVTALSL